jgi:hypothetical protein
MGPIMVTILTSWQQKKVLRRLNVGGLKEQCMIQGRI